MAPVLVVDDDAGIRSVIANVLQDEGFDVDTAGDGREALEHIESRHPSVVLLDLQMPVMTGWEVLSNLRAADDSVPVVFMTAGYRAQTEAERCRADGYLAKPFNIGELVDVVERLTHPSPA